METNLVTIVNQSGLEQTEGKTIIEKFNDYESIAKDWEQKAKSIVVTDASQTAEMTMARTGRLFLADKRITIEKTRKELKEQSLRKGQAIDAIAKFLTSLIEPTEKYLKEQEDFVKIQEAKKAEELRIELEKKAEIERIAEEKRIAEEQKKVRQENLRLQKEVEEQQKQIRAEREKAEAERLKIEESARKEREESERLARVEKEKADKILADERAEREKIQKQLNEQIECPHCHKKFNL